MTNAVTVAQIIVLDTTQMLTKCFMDILGFKFEGEWFCMTLSQYIQNNGLLHWCMLYIPYMWILEQMQKQLFF